MHEIIEANSHILDVNDFRTALLKWGREHFRPLPWRLSEDPYHTLAAELMLHRTQAPQVVPVYERFLRSYPSLPALGAASLEQLHQILYPLGLRWRIDLIHKMVADLITRFDGQVPCEKHELLSLPGVSDYIASAVRCFAWNLPEALIDTNTVRIVGRLFGLPTKDSSRRNRRFKHLLTALVDPAQPRVYSYALLDLADQVCTRKRPPDCIRCPLKIYCVVGSGNHPTTSADILNERSHG